MSTVHSLRFCQALLSPHRGKNYIFWLSLLGGLCLWGCSTTFGWLQSPFVPSPQELLQTMMSLIQEDGYQGHTLQAHWWVSITTILTSFLAASLIGIPLGILLATSDFFRQSMEHWLEWIRPIPPLAYLNIIVLLFGFGFTSKIVILFLAMVMPILMSTRSAAHQVPAEQLLSSLTFGMNRWQLIYLIILPSALPSISTGLRIAMGIGWSTLIAAEMIVPEQGIGALILNAAGYMRTDIIYIGMFGIALSAWLMDITLKKIAELYFLKHIC